MAVDADTYQVLWQSSLLDSQGLITSIPTNDVNCQSARQRGRHHRYTRHRSNHRNRIPGCRDEEHSERSGSVLPDDLRTELDRTEPTAWPRDQYHYADRGRIWLGPLRSAAELAALSPDAGERQRLCSWASHCDNGGYSGWLMAFNASNLQTQHGMDAGSLRALQGGIWMSGGGAVRRQSPEISSSASAMDGATRRPVERTMEIRLVRLTATGASFPSLTTSCPTTTPS